MGLEYDMNAIAPGSKIRREINIPEIGVPVTVEITRSGVSFWIKGFRRRVWVGWPAVVEAGTTPDDIPSFLAGRPLALLKHQASKSS